MQPRVKAVFCLLLAIATICVYWPVRHYEFVNYDDNDYVTANAHVQAGLSAESIRWAFTELHGEKTYWHPLTWLSHMLDCQLFGPNAGAHHLVNVGFHALNAALLFLFLAALTACPWRSLIVAALFAFHPLQVDTVAWVTERKNLLAGLFWIITLWSYVNFTRQRTIVRYLLTLLLFALGLMCKPVLVTLPCIMLLLDFWPLHRLSLPVAADVRRRTEPGNIPGRPSWLGWKRHFPLIIEKTPFFALSLASGFLTLWSHNQLGARGDAYGLPLLLRLENAFVSYARYLGKLVWPDNLCVLYLHPGEWPFETVLLSFLLFALLTALTVWRLRQESHLLVGWVWFVVVLLPAIGIRQAGIQAMADRFAYLPSIGIFLAAVWGICGLFRRIQLPAAMLATTSLAPLVFFTWFTSQQLPHWRNSNTLFEQALRVDPRNFVMLHNLGVKLTEQGRLDEALAKEKSCLQIRPGLVEALVQKGFIHVLKHQPEEALAAYGEALKLRPEASTLIEQSGSALFAKQKIEEAFLQFSVLAKLKPASANAHFHLGLLLASNGKHAESIAAYSETLRLQPDSVGALNNLAWLLATHPDAQFRDGQRAIQLAEKACQLTARKLPVMLGTLAAAYAEAGRFEDATRTAQDACRLSESHGETDLLNTNRKLVQAFQKQQAWREKN